MHPIHNLYQAKLYLPLSLISSINDVNYFYFKDFLTDLLDSKLVGIFTKDEEEESVLKITSEGKNALFLTIDVLPGILKLKADNVFKEQFTSINSESSIVAEYIVFHNSKNIFMFLM